MAYSKRIPPVKILVSIDRFNKFVEVLNNHSQSEDEKNALKYKKLKQKLLKYSIPREDTNGKKNIDIRFYLNETEDIIDLLLDNLKEIEIKADYYEILQKVRKELLNQNKEIS